ncbi:MAG: hypothetical protein WCF81_09990, partial [Roseiarcus sp.]
MEIEVHHARLAVVDSSRSGPERPAATTAGRDRLGGTSSRNPRFCGFEGGENRMARYSKSASKDVKGAMERRKAGALK